MSDKLKQTWNFILKPCPWCGKTPNFWLPTYENTWQWDVRCPTRRCYGNNHTFHVNIRDRQKFRSDEIYKKLSKLADVWNAMEFHKPYEATLVTFPHEDSSKWNWNNKHGEEQNIFLHSLRS